MMRLGPLKPAKQDRWDRAPESKGLWAFPFPYFDMFFAYGQYTRLLPKELKTRREVGLPGPGYLPASLDRIITVSGLPVTGLTLMPETDDDYEHFIDSATGEAVQADDAFQDARDAWVKNVGRRILPVRKFWYSGPLYSHISPAGTPGSAGTLTMAPEDTDWYRMDAVEFARLVKKIRGREGIEYSPERGLEHFKYSMDHLEVFIPATGGKIS